MNIDDIIKQECTIKELAPEFHDDLSRTVEAHLSGYEAKLKSVMEQTAGAEVLTLIEEAFGSDEKGRAYGLSWYFRRVPSLHPWRPYDLCKTGRSEEVANTLAMFIHGMF
ncbi:MAG: hypothetical protein ACMXYM_03470 [Candidatus Woesearchaeota archaeon]